ncbi:MAG: chemotaxis protein CheW [Nitrospinae bacterium]|nr:chemotaxis protein CheW [Nitrospinota bacterium]
MDTEHKPGEVGGGKNVVDRMMVKISHLDTLLNLVGEVIITSNNISTTNRRIQEFYDRQRAIDKVTMDMLKMTEVASNRASSEMHSLVMDIRMVEIRATFQRFRRAVRDMAKDAGKQVDFVTIGDETLVDKTIAEKLYDPLNHQIRNAIDHGVEDPLERQRMGKGPMSKVTLRAYQKENNVFIEIRDDGRGIDPESVAKAAVNRGIIEEGALSSMTTEEKLALIFHPGLSTKVTASKISGRGVGMDVVKSNIEQLGGDVAIDTKIGEGTAFTYRIPQITAVNILDCLTVLAGKSHYAIPILNVVSTLSMPASNVHTTLQKGRSITHLGSLVTLFDLNELLGGKPLDPADEITIVIVEAKNGRVSVRVSELLMPEKLVFTPLSKMFSVQGISGTTTMSGNKMGMIIDVFELINRSRGVVLGGETAPVERVGRAQETSGGALQSAAVVAGGTAVEEVDEVEKKEDISGKLVLSSDIGKEIGHREEFFVELEDILRNVDEQILSLENNPSDMDIVNRIFRDFHSMKGNLMMVGLTELGGFIHEVEVILDQARSGSLEITEEIIDILLDSADIIKAAKQAIAEGRAPVIDRSLLKSIEKYKKPKEKKVEEPVDIHNRTFHIGSLERINLFAHRRAEKHLYQLFISFTPKSQQAFLVALLILKRLARIGHIFGCVPTAEEIENQSISNQLKVMFSSPMDEAPLRKFVEDVLMRYYDVNEYEILKTS